MDINGHQFLPIVMNGYPLPPIIRAVAEKRSSPELRLANRTKMHLKQKNELKIARVWGCSTFWPAASPHGMYPGVSIYGTEADPPRFLYLKDECFLMTNWCDIDISLIMKNSVCDLDFKVSEEVGGGKEQHIILAQYLTSGIVSTSSIQRFKRHPILKILTKNFSLKFQKSVTLTSRLGMVQH